MSGTTPPPRLAPVGDDKSLADRAADRLRTAIQGGVYRPGDRLVERKLAGELGVSHIPIREALARLAEEGLVERLPRRGSRVAALSAKDLRDLSGLRVVLEQHVASCAQEAWTPAAEQSLRRIVAKMIAAAERRNTQRLFDLDVQFHQELWRLADNAPLEEVVTHLRGRISGFLRAATAAIEPEELVDHARDHGEIVDALASGDRERASAAMAAHVIKARDRIAAAREPGAA